MGVVMVHSAMAMAPTNEHLLWCMRQGARGVQLFFIVSAFTLSTSWMNARKNEHHFVKHYAIRRLFRIAPMFYLAIAVYMLLNGRSNTYWAPNGISWWSICSTALFVHGLHPESINAVVPGGWSISVEMFFYIAFPFLIKRIQSLISAFMFMLICLALNRLNGWIAPLIFSYPHQQQYIADNFNELNFLSQLPLFGMGMAAFAMLRNGDHFSGKLQNTCFFVALIPLTYLTSKNPSTLLAGFAFTLVLILLAKHPLRLLVNPFTITLGKWSYSIYLVHFLVLTTLHHSNINQYFSTGNLSSLTYFSLVLMLSAAMAYMTYRAIERPGIALGQRIIERQCNFAHREMIVKNNQ